MTQSPTDQDWARLKTLFAELLPLPAAERAARLEAAAAGDEWLRAEVVALLASAAGDALLDAPLEARANALFQPGIDAPGDALPESIGPYRPLRLLGSGGMGAVYLAERSDGAFAQWVALKLIHAGFTHPEAHARFLRERRILAGLRHPGIAQLFDGGVSAQGLPYFTMEWVEGEPITAWCARQGLDTGARVDLFLRVLDAVAYAHRHLVVHRDIKPANLLVSTGGVPKLLDFGIAKLIDGSEDATQTSHSRPFTPSYAAPEQIFNEAITTATDVYALGALLYELLAGRAPRRPRGQPSLALDGDDYERAPPKLAVALRESAAKSSARDAEAMRRRARDLASGDLDQIVRAALERQPEHRYASVDAMADDLRAWRAHLPLLSRPTPWPRRARKFLRRHWRGLAVATALSAAIVAGVAGSWYQARQAARAARTSAAVREVLTELFSAADPGVAQGRDIRVRDLLDQGRQRVRVRLRDAPEVRAELQLDLGRIYRSLGEDVIAVELFDEALPAMPADLDRARVLIERSGAHRTLGHHDLARADAERALVLTPQDSSAQLDATVALAEVEASLDRLAAADALLDALERSLAAAPDTPERDARRSTLLSQRALLAEQQGRLDEAERLMRAAIASSDAAPDHPDRGVDHVNLGQILQALGRYDEAERELRDGIARHARVLGPEHPLTLSARKELAIVLDQQRRYDESEREYRAAIDGYRRTLGPDHPATGLALHNYAVAQYNRGNYAEAEAQARAALAIARRDLPPTHERVTVATMVMAAAMLENDRVAAAVPLLEEHLRVMRARGVANDLPSALNTLAIGYIKQGRAEEALALTAENLGIEARLPGFTPKHSYWTRVIAARAEFTAGRRERALAAQRQLLADYRSGYGSDLGPRAAMLMLDLAATLRALQREPAEARALIDEAIAIRSTKLGAEHPLTRAAKAL